MLSGLILGVINILIVVVVLLLVGALIEWVLTWLGVGVTITIRKLYIGVVALIALYMLVALVFGIPTVRLIGERY